MQKRTDYFRDADRLGARRHLRRTDYFRDAVQPGAVAADRHRPGLRQVLPGQRAQLTVLALRRSELG